MGTIKEVARRAGVSVGTVSNVLNGVPVSAKLQARVDRAIRELNYHPNHVASSLKARRTHTLGMVISDITNPFFPRLVRGAEDAALKHGYVITIINTDDQLDRERQAFSLLRRRRVDGALAVIAPNPQGDFQHLKDTIGAGIPVVFLDRATPAIKTDAVLVDNVKGALVCVRHLIAMGHRRIGILTGSAALQTARDRLAGYELALKEAGIPLAPDLIREGDFRFESGYRNAKALLLEHPRPTALFVANGTMGLGACKAFQELGLDCPGDIAIAVFDDVPGGDVFRPTLTVVSQPAYRQGFEATELLVRRINGEIESKDPVVIKLDTELTPRDSTLLRLPATDRSNRRASRR
jgi:LacI family transcriptional regulator